MPETNSKNYGTDSADNAHSETNVVKSKSSLRSKLKTIRDKADAEVAELKSEKIPVKREIRTKIYDLNRRIKTIQHNIDQNNEKINGYKSGAITSSLPIKYVVKLIKLENTMLTNSIAVYTEIIADHNAEIEAIDLAINDKISVIRAKTEKALEAERQRNADRRKQKLEKQRAKHKSEVQAKREAKKDEERVERLKSQLRLRQYVNFQNEPVVVSKASLPGSIQAIYDTILSSFTLVEDQVLVGKVMESKLSAKYFSMIRKGMAETLNVSPADTLLLSLKQEAENPDILEIIFHVNKDRKIENLIAQFGFSKNSTTGNMEFVINTKAENYAALLGDFKLLFSDLSKFIKCLVDVIQNSVLKKNS